MKKHRIHYSFIHPDGSVTPNQETPWYYDRDEANEIWTQMKTMPCFANMVPETVDEVTVEKHIVTVAFKTYDYLVEGPVKKGQYVEVISGGDVIKLKVLELDPPRKSGIDYKYVERVCSR